MHILYKTHYYIKIALFKITVILRDTQATTFNAEEGDIMTIVGGRVID